MSELLPSDDVKQTVPAKLWVGLTLVVMVMVAPPPDSAVTGDLMRLSLSSVAKLRDASSDNAAASMKRIMTVSSGSIAQRIPHQINGCKRVFYLV